MNKFNKYILANNLSDTSLGHQIGNMISGLLSIIDGIVTFSTLGFVRTTFTFRWAVYRISGSWFSKP